MNGDIVGAVTASDEARLLEQADQRGLLPEKRVSELTVVLSGDHSIFGPLLDEIPPADVDQLLFDRFRENLLRFVNTGRAPTFEAMPGVFVDNMQMGHVSATLIEWATRSAESAEALDPDLELVRTASGLAYASADPLEQALLSRVDAAPTVQDLVDATPGEPTLLKATIAKLVAQGYLDAEQVALAPLTEALAPGEEDADDVDAPTMIASTEVIARAEGIARPDDEPVDLQSMIDTLHPDDEPTVPVGAGADFLDDPTYDGDISEILDDEPEVDAGVDYGADLGDYGADLGDFGADHGPVSPANAQDLAMWLDTGEDVSEDDLAFFEDHEDDRGQGAGGFSTETHNLDKVEVGRAAEPEPEEEVLEAGEATTTKYGAPVLSDSEAVDKIEVLNDVLRRISEAFDEASGAGRGPAAIQLLVDGAPAKYSAVLHDLNIDETGEVPPEDILGNLAGRPLSEQRLVLNGAIKDLIGRALSTAADELPEEVFDDVFESVAGYNTRLGL